MVFEQLYPPGLLLSKPRYAFLMGVGYSVIGMAIALFLFPRDPAFVAVALTSILFMPSLGGIAKIEERADRVGTHLVTTMLPFVRVYLAAFLGIFLTYVFFGAALSKLAASALFKAQLDVLLGAATFSYPLLKTILVNNVSVFMLCFVLSLIAGNGAIFLITWNASVWGTIFGSIARAAADQTFGNPFILVAIILVAVFPHVILEILGYIGAVASGTVISDGLVTERVGSLRFGHVVRHNLILLLLGFGILVLGALVETWVLGNVDVYTRIAQLAFGA